MKAPTETALVKAAIEFLRLRKSPPDFRFMCWRNNTGMLPNPRGRPVPFGLVGSSDILGIVSPHGQFLAAEAKMPGKQPTPAQEAFLSEVDEAGGLAIVFHDLAELEQALVDVGL
jgi:hypothetical protein